ncbi:MAG: glycosyltransferase family 2 protein [Sphingobacteriia bacterium]|nr:glycosyltransferase family 2 protein [Paludibacteraceae bacterium]NCA79429.1 glycosyltransferase family 2 protein [Sphingobacteriia bacterium]
MQPKISIIVPVYNAGNYLRHCLDTLVNQTLRDIEIILIIDCPTDGSDEICREYAANDNRIVIINNVRNLHIGNSRNEGLKIAQGEYIGFSDHDDYRTLDMYEKLYAQAIENDTDIILGTSVAVGDQNEVLHFPISTKENPKNFALRDLLSCGSDETFTPLALNIHPNIYRNDWLKINEIQFVNTTKCTPEDRIFQIMCLCNTDKVAINHEQLYFHCIYAQSSGQIQSYTGYKERANGKLIIYNFLNNKGLYDNYQSEFLIGVKKEFTELIVNELITTKSIKKAMNVIKYLKTFQFCQKAFQQTHYSLKRYRLGGKMSRIFVFCLIKLKKSILVNSH